MLSYSLRVTLQLWLQCLTRDALMMLTGAPRPICVKIQRFRVAAGLADGSLGVWTNTGMHLLVLSFLHSVAQCNTCFSSQTLVAHPGYPVQICLDGMYFKSIFVQPLFDIVYCVRRQDHL